MSSVTYTVQITHSDDGEVDVVVKGVGSTERNRISIAYALRRAAELVENGLPIDLNKLN